MKEIIEYTDYRKFIKDYYDYAKAEVMRQAINQ